MGIDYKIEWKHVSGQPRGERRFTSLQDDACRVTIEIGNDHFSDVVSVPLFLSELHHFLEEVSSEPRAIWRLEFEPFRYGYNRAGKLDITLDSKGQKVVAKLSPSELVSLLGKVRRDMKRYGSIQMTRPDS